MENYVLKLPRAPILHKITSVILEMEKLNHLLNEDFLSIMKPSEITKILKKIPNLGQYRPDANS